MLLDMLIIKLKVYVQPFGLYTFSAVKSYGK